MKSVLVVAGMLKRAEPSLPEDSLLMRALRDFNTPKIVHSDEVRRLTILMSEISEITSVQGLFLFESRLFTACFHPTGDVLGTLGT